MHIKINFTKILQSFVLVSGLGFMLVLSLPGLASAQANNPFTQPVNQDQATENAINQAINNKKNSVPAKDRNAAASPYCKGYYLDLGTYEGSKLQACVTGVLQKLSGVNGNYPSTDAPCMKYSSDLGGGAGDITHKYGICMVGYNAVPVTNANKASFLGGNNASDIKNQAKKDAEDAQASASSNSDDQVNCDANESPLSWIACPLIDAGAGMSDYIFNNFVQPLLENVPISADSKDGSFLAWQTFRIFGNAILVGSLLVMVFAQNFGRFVDAYTIRKMAPRIVIGAIAINISFYLCLAAIDIVNVIGNGLNQALTAPFIDENTFKEGIPIDATAANNITGILGAGLLVAAAGAIFGAVATIGALGIISLMLPLIISVALVSLAVLFTIIIRQALLIFLTAISAVAIACFILPGTEKYFRQWWDLFLKALMVYPIIAVIFAMSNVMASIILRSAGGGALGTAQIITAILVVYAPLVLIPFAFKFAGGAIGNLMDLAGKRAQGIAGRTSESGVLKGRRERAQRDFQGGVIQRRADMADSLKGRATGSAFRRKMMGGLAGAVGGYNIEAQASAFRAARAKELNDQIATGRDEEIRGLTVNKQWALSQGKEATADNWNDGDYRTKDGVRQFKTLGGAWVNEADVDAGYNRWGNDTFAQQAALSYEMRKAMTDEEVGRISSNYKHVATGAGGWGNSETQARGGFIGAAFENQNQHLEYKYTDALTGELKAEEFTKEIYEKRGSYPLAQMSAHTFKQLQNAYDAAPENSQTRANVKAVAESFMTRYGGGGGIAGMEGDNPITQGMVGGSRPGSGGNFQTNSAGAAHVSEAVRDLAEHVGVYGPAKNNPEQN